MFTPLEIKIYIYIYNYIFSNSEYFFLVLHRRFSNLWITKLKKLVNDEIQIKKIFIANIIDSIINMHIHIKWHIVI